MKHYVTELLMTFRRIIGNNWFENGILKLVEEEIFVDVYEKVNVYPLT